MALTVRTPLMAILTFQLPAASPSPPQPVACSQSPTPATAHLRPAEMAATAETTLVTERAHLAAPRQRRRRRSSPARRKRTLELSAVPVETSVPVVAVSAMTAPAASPTPAARQSPAVLATHRRPRTPPAAQWDLVTLVSQAAPAQAPMRWRLVAGTRLPRRSRWAALATESALR